MKVFSAYNLAPWFSKLMPFSVFFFFHDTSTCYKTKRNWIRLQPFSIYILLYIVNCSLSEKIAFLQIIKTHLRINNLNVDDEGTYRCIARDKNNCTDFREGKLDVLNVKRHNECKYTASMPYIKSECTDSKTMMCTRSYTSAH